MARHLEFVFGPIGEELRLPCACPREADHLRPTSASLEGLAESGADDESDPERHPRAEPLRPLRPRRRARRRTRFALAATQRARHAA